MSSSDLYGELRPRAFAIAYQMLGSVSEAEDVVQEAFLRMHQTLRRDERITSPRAYIATLVTRLAIDQLRSARVRRERYVGEWLPEPLVTDPSPAEHAETADSLSLAFLVLLESLSPRQRAAFLLREVFDYPYAEVAEIIGTDVDSTRHLVARARTHVQERRPRYYASRRQREELAQRFFAAAEQGDLRALEALLAQDAALHGDGGGKVPALARPINGRDRVARTLLAGMSALPRLGVRIQVTEVNGQPGAMAFDSQDRLVAVIGLGIADGQIQTIHSIVNPDKLRHFDRVGDLGALVRAGRRPRRSRQPLQGDPS
ncbi:RNA polymerase sigma-70 factor [Micromonospora coerulea]|uniref:RNA polymerase sigma-70 factor n=1 Tax=Micromonospora coerulea TaxID=47856 RepID=UPI001908E858|nr:RNA polymerase sigma-70 factor [Micromonospora veneta]